jgi:2-succinyl-5-enolpyruvyl-6-hydroxy-3-cyclohexene-1-carboxylate synthase
VDATLAADALDWLLKAPKETHALFPDVVLRFGGTPVAAGIEQLLSAHGPTELALVGEHGFADPTSSASLFVRGEAGAVGKALCACRITRRRRRAYRGA